MSTRLYRSLKTGEDIRALENATSMLLDKGPAMIKYEAITPILKELTTSELPDLYSTFRATVDPRSSPLKMSPKPPAAMYSRTAGLVTPVTIRDWGITGIFEMTVNMNRLARCSIFMFTS